MRGDQARRTTPEIGTGEPHQSCGGDRIGPADGRGAVRGKRHQSEEGGSIRRTMNTGSLDAESGRQRRTTHTWNTIPGTGGSGGIGHQGTTEEVGPGGRRGGAPHLAPRSPVGKGECRDTRSTTQPGRPGPRDTTLPSASRTATSPAAAKGDRRHRRRQPSRRPDPAQRELATSPTRRSSHRPLARGSGHQWSGSPRAL